MQHHFTKNSITFQMILMLGKWLFIFKYVNVSAEYYLFILYISLWIIWLIRLNFDKICRQTFAVRYVPSNATTCK